MSCLFSRGEWLEGTAESASPGVGLSPLIDLLVAQWPLKKSKSKRFLLQCHKSKLSPVFFKNMSLCALDASSAGFPASTVGV